MIALFNQSCETIETRIPEQEAGKVEYLIDTDEPRFTDLDGQTTDPNARTAKGKLIFEY